MSDIKGTPEQNQVEAQEVEAVEERTDTIPPTVSTLNLLLLDPSLTAKAVVLELLILITPVLVIVPVLVIAPLLKVTPEIEIFREKFHCLPAVKLSILHK